MPAPVPVRHFSSIRTPGRPSPSPWIADERIPELVHAHSLFFVLSCAEVESLVFSVRPYHWLCAVVSDCGIHPRSISPSRADWPLPSGDEYVWTLEAEDVSEAAAAVVVTVAVTRPDELELVLLPCSRGRVVVDPGVIVWIWYPIVCHCEWRLGGGLSESQKTLLHDLVVIWKEYLQLIWKEKKRNIRMADRKSR
jgi:hypothetical protein